MVGTKTIDRCAQKMPSGHSARIFVSVRKLGWIHVTTHCYRRWNIGSSLHPTNKEAVDVVKGDRWRNPSQFQECTVCWKIDVYHFLRLARGISALQTEAQKHKHRRLVLRHPEYDCMKQSRWRDWGCCFVAPFFCMTTLGPIWPHLLSRYWRSMASIFSNIRLIPLTSPNLISIFFKSWKKNWMGCPLVKRWSGTLVLWILSDIRSGDLWARNKRTHHAVWQNV